MFIQFVVHLWGIQISSWTTQFFRYCLWVSETGVWISINLLYHNNLFKTVSHSAWFWDIGKKKNLWRILTPTWIFQSIERHNNTDFSYLKAATEFILACLTFIAKTRQSSDSYLFYMVQQWKIFAIYIPCRRNIKI